MTKVVRYPLEFKILDFLESAQITTVRALGEILAGLDTSVPLAVRVWQIIFAPSGCVEN